MQRATSAPTKGTWKARRGRPPLHLSGVLFLLLRGFGENKDNEAESDKYIRVRPPDRPRKLTPVLPSLGMRAFPDPLPPAVVDELVERSSLPHRLRHRVERRTERALELFLRSLSYDVVSAVA